MMFLAEVTDYSRVFICCASLFVLFSASNYVVILFILAILFFLRPCVQYRYGVNARVVHAEFIIYFHVLTSLLAITYKRKEIKKN